MNQERNKREIKWNVLLLPCFNAIDCFFYYCFKYIENKYRVRKSKWNMTVQTFEHYFFEQYLVNTKIKFASLFKIYFSNSLQNLLRNSKEAEENYQNSTSYRETIKLLNLSDSTDA